LVTVLDQIIAPKPVELQLLQHEQVAFPDWEEPCCEDDPVVTEFCAREQAGWAAADLILCGSEFVREGIARCGGPVERCAVVPYGVPLPRNDNALRREDRGRDPNELRVLTVGTVGLRKGSPYVLDAARRLKARQGGKIRFRMVGPVAIRPKALAGLREHVEVLGPVPRAEVGEHFAWADVFLLPSLCEGSATVTYEALVRGLPVVATPNTGSLVRDGVEGFIVPVRDGEAIAERLQELASNRDRLHAMAMAARARGVEATVEAYGARLRQALELRFMQLAAA
jgi:glycosyltransferase involved in cell wall biosynthesis